MPIYEYQCRHCGHVFEVLQPLGAPPPNPCPKCGRPEIERKPSVFAGGRKRAPGCAPGGG